MAAAARYRGMLRPEPDRQGFIRAATRTRNAIRTTLQIYNKFTYFRYFMYNTNA